MINIKNMEIAPALSSDSRVVIKRGFLGLSKKAVLNSTQEILDLQVHEYVPDAEFRLTELLASSGEQLKAEVKKGSIDCVPVGHLRLESARTNDHLFLAVQLFRFLNFDYVPVTEYRVFEGEDAIALASIL